MSYPISKTVLIKDCNLLFDSQIVNYVDFLDKLTPIKLRLAYRKKALATHPDRSHTLGKDRETLNKSFKKMNTAYERLESIIKGDKKYVIKDTGLGREAKKTTKCTQTRKSTKPSKSAIKAKTTTQTKQTTKTIKRNLAFSLKSIVIKTASRQNRQQGVSDHYYKGNVPNCELLIGQFLYYTGLISWRTLNQAIIWQRKQRPILGKIAMDWGILSSDDIQKIMNERSYKDKIGEYALRNGYITNFQHMAIIGRQRKLQPRIGQYFIQEKILRSYDISKMIVSLRSHNTKVMRYNRARSTSITTLAV